jgi:prevent-host-death family protein
MGKTYNLYKLYVLKESIMTVTKTVKSGDARAMWRDLLDRVYAGQEDVVIERNGKDVVALIPAEDYEAVREALEDLRSARAAAAAYAEWKRDPSVARPWEDIDAELRGAGGDG